MAIPWIILIVGPAVLALLARLGCLRRDALDAGPPRDVGLVPADLLVTLGLMIVGPSLVAQLLPAQARPDEVDALAYAGKALLVQASGQLVPVLYLLWRVSAVPRGLRLFGAVPHRPLRDLGWGTLGFLAAVPMIMAMIQATVLVGEQFGEKAPAIGHPMLRVIVGSDSLTASALLMFSALVAAPILEETIFRGLIQTVLLRILGVPMRWGVVFIAALVFMAIHVGGVSWQTLPGLFVLGFVLGWLYERSGSLWPSIVAHIGFNALNIAIALGTVAPDG
jgi:CAAX protease family protein